MPRLILASTSVYRRDLLARLGLPFETARPRTDETPGAGEAPRALAVRLARAKALALAGADAWVIGSDQAAELDGAPLGKPGTFAAAQAQLAAMSGRRVRFHTAVCLAGPEGIHEAVDLTEVHFRALSEEEIDRYLQAESPLDCAGSFKCEGLGISLFEAIENRDPTALVGLPLIATARLLRQAGFRVP
ncbi:Maf family nucleotide pyrophosphatase [Stenotrophomonas sp. HITSZ_GD]|uniref:Maf family protein n=1 Tax=Stenotrophomonas sp. HITSZ_GD TaxID=3037248 RepID=UPI00240E87DD|nr:Maf family nucleotide pyrophosphatase [Stenotrophomonas sp. HITSZ_GD]MDG2524867.1 Maf family nucleotide pyrophosphatase [Stenotrophomonas sp. HITSZ_GD]